MPIYDFKCPKCDRERKDVFTRTWQEGVRCECGEEMLKVPSAFAPHTFPVDGIFLEHVSPEGKRFHSKKEMRDYAKAHDLEIDYLE